MNDETLVADPATSAVPDQTGDPGAQTAPATTETPATETQADPSDPYLLLQEAMKSQLGDEPAPEATKTEETPAIPAELQNVFNVSDFVKSPQHVEQAIRAADEVWKVAAGQVPASSMLEGMRAANPQATKRLCAI